MSKSARKTNQVKFISRDKVARAVFAAAESMGISDRKMLEELSSQIIQRLEPARPLPGMEKFVSPKPQHPVTSSQIEVAVKEALAEKETLSQTGIELSQNALRVLERRYLKKDGEGKVVETPQELFRRVAKHIASA